MCSYAPACLPGQVGMHLNGEGRDCFENKTRFHRCSLCLSSNDVYMASY